jgi:hypothetical protein
VIKLLYQLLAHGRWFSPTSSITKTDRHDIAEILLKVALKHQNKKNHYFCAKIAFYRLIIILLTFVYKAVQN